MWKIPLGQLVYGGGLEVVKVDVLTQRNKIEQAKATINAEIIAAQSALLIAKEQMEIAKEGKALACLTLQQNIQRQALGQFVHLRFYKFKRFLFKFN